MIKIKKLRTQDAKDKVRTQDAKDKEIKALKDQLEKYTKILYAYDLKKSIRGSCHRKR